MRITAIDPGPTNSAIVTWMTGDAIDGPPSIMHHEIMDNRAAREHVAAIGMLAGVLVVEMIASYGMAVGAEVFETCVWIGRFLEAWGNETTQFRVLRREVKTNLCHDSRAKDSNIRQAIIDRFGGKERAIGKKAAPGPLFGIKGDEWAALAVALTYADRSAKPTADKPPF